MKTYAILVDLEVYATGFESEDEAYGFVGAYLGGTDQPVMVVEVED